MTVVVFTVSSCRKLLVSFVATALTEPDIFGPSGLSDLMKQLGYGLGGGSVDPVLVFLMKDLVDELTGLDSFEMVIRAILHCNLTLSWLIKWFLCVLLVLIQCHRCLVP